MSDETTTATPRRRMTRTTDAAPDYATEQTCATMADAVKVAARRELGLTSAEDDEWLRQWVKLRLVAYKDHGWDGDDMEPMIEWIAIDLAIDEKDAATLIRKAAQP